MNSSQSIEPPATNGVQGSCGKLTFINSRALVSHFGDTFHDVSHWWHTGKYSVSYWLLTTHPSVDNLSRIATGLSTDFLHQPNLKRSKTRVNPEPFRPTSPMTKDCVIAKFIEDLCPCMLQLQQSGYPRFLWVTLWITMFTNGQSRASGGFAPGASQIVNSVRCQNATNPIATVGSK
jgi:hypothetical protein